jgi:hypothetical protein
LSHRDIALIRSTIDNGRIYFQPSDMKFFPSNAFGDREGDGHKGTPVVFRAAGVDLETDIRISSGERLSPRCSFGAFLKNVGAVEGGILRVTRTADREYLVEYIG